jgi:hypothetical protein
LYVARTYKNGLQRPNAFVNEAKSILQPEPDRPRLHSDRYSVSGQQKWPVTR